MKKKKRNEKKHLRSLGDKLEWFVFFSELGLDTNIDTHKNYVILLRIPIMELPF